MLDFDKFCDVLPTELALEIMGIPLTEVNMEEKAIWTFNANGKFSIKSAYNIINNKTRMITNQIGPGI